MAEIAASIIGIASFGVGLTHELYEFGSTTNAAREQTDYIARHVTLYSNVLEILGERLNDDQPIHSRKALGIAEELQDQSNDLFNTIRKLLPRPRPGQDDLSFIQKIKWNFQRSKVELLVGEIEYLKSTVHLLITVLYAGSRIRSYRHKKHKSKTDHEAIQNQCLKAQNAIVEQINASELLSTLKKNAETDFEHPVRLREGSTHPPRESALILNSADSVAKFQNSIQSQLQSVHDSAERRKLILRGSVNWVQILLNEWTTLADDHSGNSFASNRQEESDIIERYTDEPIREASGKKPKSDKDPFQQVSSSKDEESATAQPFPAPRSSRKLDATFNEADTRSAAVATTATQSPAPTNPYDKLYPMHSHNAHMEDEIEPIPIVSDNRASSGAAQGYIPPLPRTNTQRSGYQQQSLQPQGVQVYSANPDPDQRRAALAHNQPQYIDYLSSLSSPQISTAPPISSHHTISKSKYDELGSKSDPKASKVSNVMSRTHKQRTDSDGSTEIVLRLSGKLTIRVCSPKLKREPMVERLVYHDVKGEFQMIEHESARMSLRWTEAKTGEVVLQHFIQRNAKAKLYTRLVSDKNRQRYGMSWEGFNEIEHFTNPERKHQSFDAIFMSEEDRDAFYSVYKTGTRM